MAFTIAVAIFVLGILIFVHELGHFLAAKLVDIQVLRFSIGLGKPVVSRRWGETEYSLSAIPFGGYVKMAGDDPTEALEGKVEQTGITTDTTRHFDKKSLFQRFVVIFAGPLMNFLLAMVLYMGILYFQGAETTPSTTVEAVEEELILPGMEKLVPGSKILRVNGSEVANWHEIIKQVVNSSSPSTVLELLDAERNKHYSISVPTPDDSTRQQLAASMQPLVAPRIGTVIPGKPADKAGLKPGDLILSLDGKPVKSWKEMSGIINASAGDTLTVVVNRDGRRLTFEVSPEKSMVPQGGDTFVEKGLIHIRPQMERIDLSLAEACVNGATNTIYTTAFIIRSMGHLLGGLITREISMRQARDFLGGPVMIGQMAGESARSGQLWAFMAILSINLAILNLLPIPVLDGGHLLFLFIELVRFGKPLTPQQRMRFIQVGLLIVMALMLLATANDLRRLFGL